jgi:NADPH:quinone reductase-like Zn-dependent oxidoreductase
MRPKDTIEFPLILGRDFSGVIVQKGLGVSDRELHVGQDVWGVVPVHKQGCHAEYVLVDRSCLSEKPHSISEVDASAVLYAGLTAWSGLFVSGQLGNLCGALSSGGGGKEKRVLVLGASGGVGSMAIQILLAEGCEIFATCSTDAMPMVRNLGVDAIFDYKDPKHVADLILCGPYDIILDCAGKGTEYANEVKWQFKNYVTFSSPLLKNIDNFGMISGAFRNAVNIVQSNFTSVGTQNGVIKWGYFMPAPQGIAYLKNLVERQKLLPVVEQVYKFGDTLEAYKHVKRGHLRGKIVIDCK